MGNHSAPSSSTNSRYDVSLPPNQSSLHAQHQALASVQQASYWQQLNPGLHVNDAAFVKRCKAIKLHKERLRCLRGQMITAGVAQVDSAELLWTVDLDVLADAVVHLVRHGWPPSMLLVYDEVWALVHQASVLMEKVTGGNQCNMDILAWLVDPNRGDAGFSPHRDRQPDDAAATFRQDGTAKYSTMWVPVTPATPENSCLYVIPRFADPGYFEGDPEDESSPDPLTAALSSKEAYQHIRALPAQTGSALLFTHRTIHWGSRGQSGYPTPRISLSWGCADDSYEPAYFSREHLPCPPLALRLALAGAQMIIYHERFPAPPKQLALYYQAFRSQADKFDAEYKAKVKREFVDAGKESAAGAAAALTAAAAEAATPDLKRVAAAANGGAHGHDTPCAAAAAASGEQLDHSSAVALFGLTETENSGKQKKRRSSSSSRSSSKKIRAADVPAQHGVDGSPSAAPQPTPHSNHEPGRKMRRKDGSSSRQDEQQTSSVGKKQKAAAASALTAAAKLPRQSKDCAADRDTSRPSTQQAKRHKHSTAAVEHVAAALPKTVLGETDGSDSEEEDGVDIACLLAGYAPASILVEGQQPGPSIQEARAGKGHTGAAAGNNDEEDVLDLALEAMLDGDGDFIDDYQED